MSQRIIPCAHGDRVLETFGLVVCSTPSISHPVACRRTCWGRKKEHSEGKNPHTALL